jgi:hypothetical protein
LVNESVSYIRRDRDGSEERLRDVLIPREELNGDELAEEVSLVQHVVACEGTRYFFKLYKGPTESRLPDRRCLLEILQSRECERHDFAKLFELEQDVILD